MSARKPELDSTQRRYADEARELAEVPLENLAAAVMNADPGNLALTYGLAFGEARAHIRNLLAVIGELTSQPTAQDDAGRAIVADLGEPEQPEADERGARLGGELRRMGAIAADLGEQAPAPGNVFGWDVGPGDDYDPGPVPGEDGDL